MLWRDLQDAVHWIIRIIIPFLRSLIVAAVLVVSGMALEALVGLTLPKESKSLEIVRFVLDVSLVGSAVVIAICGALIVVWDTVASTRGLLSRGKD